MISDFMRWGNINSSGTGETENDTREGGRREGLEDKPFTF
jgi:hypothetical protein